MIRWCCFALSPILRRRSRLQADEGLGTPDFTLLNPGYLLYSRSIFPVGLLVTSYLTQCMPFTLLIIRIATAVGQGKSGWLITSVAVNE
jgi:hypothetical protein